MKGLTKRGKGRMVEIIILWGVICVPLTFAGSYYGFRHPVRYPLLPPSLFIILLMENINLCYLFYYYYYY